MRVVSDDLLDCLRRPNPYVETYAEVQTPDVLNVLRRKDQFEAPVAGTTAPVGGLQVGANGELKITPTVVNLINYATSSVHFDLNGENEERRRKGITWTVDSLFVRALLRNFSAGIKRYPVAGIFYLDLDWQLQIFRVTRTPGVKETVVRGNPVTTPFTQYAFAPILSSPAVIKAGSIAWGAPAGDGGEIATLSFDLSAYNIVIANTPGDATRPDYAGELPQYHFVLTPIKHPKGTGYFQWLCNNTDSRDVAGVGHFETVFWARNNEDDQWVAAAQGTVPLATIAVENYAGTSSAIFALDMGKAPNTAAGSIGRAVFERTLPPGSTATLEVSTAGVGGPFVEVKHGDNLSRINYIKQPEKFDDAVWTKTATGAGVLPVITPNAAIAPDGRQTADLIVFNSPAGGGDQSNISQNDYFPISVGGRYVESLWVKALNPANVGKQLLMRGVGRAAYALITLTGDWQRVQKAETAFSATTYFEFGMRPGAGSGGSAGVVSVYVWHGQLEPGEVATEPSTQFAAQQTYHVRVTLSASADGRSSPGVRAFGLEYRIPVDVSAESSVAWPTREIAVPWLASSIPEGKLKIVRTGVRDYDDPASQLGAKFSPTKLEADIYLRSKHPSVDRSKWLLLERMSVTNRVPSGVAEEFSLLSYLHRTKKTIPEKRESVASTHTVQAGSTAAQLIVAPNLPGVTVAGNELDNKHFYIRVPSTAKIEFVDGFIQEVAGNTNVNKLDFNPALPGVLNTGDVIELHSGIFGTAPIVWQDADPADVWNDLLVTYGGIPPERIGHGSLPRGGRPPRVTDIEPGDVTAQGKRKITFAAREDEPVDEMLDQVSFITGGATVEIDGQICYVQIYPLYAATGVISVPLPAVAKTFDPRDFNSPSTSPSLEDRTTVVTAIYGVNAAATNADAYPERLTVGVDVDAVAWLTQQSIFDIGNSELPDKVSRWLYNSSDSGLYLASLLAAQVVRAGSTGMRVFGFTTIDQYPELTPGDVIVLVTDQYTDYDPATARELRGWLAIKGVIVKATGGGKSFGMYVQGLADNVTTLKGGIPGSLAGVGEPPGNPLIVASFDNAGKPTVNVFAGEGTVSAKIAVSDTATPADATVEATLPINADIFAVSFVTPAIAPGGTLYIKLFEYTELDGLGVRSEPFTISFIRPTGDVAQPPRADMQVQAESQTASTIRLTGTLNPGDVGPLQYRYRVDTNGVTGAWSAWAAFPSGGGTYVDIVQTKNNFYKRDLVGQVRDSSPTPVESDLIIASIPGRFESMNPGSGRVDPVVPLQSGFNVFQYGADTSVGVVETAGQKFIDGGALDVSRRPVSVYRSAAYEPTANLFKKSSDTTTDVVTTVARAFVASGMIDASARVVNVYRSTATESVDNLFKRGSNDAGDVVTTTVRTFVDPNASTQVDGSGRIVGVYRLGVYEPVNNLVKAGDHLSVSGFFGTSSRTLSGAWTIDSFNLNGNVAYKLILLGSPTNINQIALGSSSVWGILGTQLSSGAVALTYNASQTTFGVDTWTQSLSALGSTLFEVSVNGIALYGAVAGKAVGNKATFWGAVLAYMSPAGAIGGLHQLRMGNQAGSNGVAGDVIAARSSTAGAYYFGNSTTAYLYFDGSNFFFGAAGSYVSATDFKLA